MKPRKIKNFSPSMAGACLRYAVMDLLGFGRAIDEESRARMAAGSQWHKVFQSRLAAHYPVVATEARVKDEELGVSGRMDAVVEVNGLPTVVEYKTTAPEKFARILTDGPPVSFWAQLALYLEVTGYRQGMLVVDERSEDVPIRRLVFQQEKDPAWSEWVRARVTLAREWAYQGELPARETGDHCLSCDRWQRCFRTVAARDEAVAVHPRWDPKPGLAVLKSGRPAVSLVQ